MNGGKNDLNNNDLCISALNHFTVAPLLFKSLISYYELIDHHFTAAPIQFIEISPKILK